MPGGVFAISVILIWLFIFVDSRITGHKKNYSYYIKYGLFVGSMNALLFYISNGIWPTLPQIGGNSGATVQSFVSPVTVMTGLPNIF